jgi:hypothetical protein
MTGVSENKSPMEEAVEQAVEHALDLFVYAPLGLLFNASEVLPDLVEKGRKQVQTARLFGHYAVKKGSAKAGQAVARVQEQAGVVAEQVNRNAAGASRGTAAPADVAEAPIADSSAGNGAGDARPAAPPPAPTSGPSAAALAIPDYDSLSASQVVPRLAGLTPDELDAVGAYEAAHRGRKTILNRVAQLQGGR